MIELSNENKTLIITKLKTYFNDELDMDIGSFDAEFLLDFFLREFSGLIYNQALTDVHALLQKQIDSMSESIYDLEKPVNLK